MKDQTINIKDLTSEQIQDLKRQLEELDNKPTPEERFWQLADLESVTPYVDFEKYPGRLFWRNKEGKAVMEYAQKSGDMWVSFLFIWKFLEQEYSYNYDEISELIKKEVEGHFNLKTKNK